MFDCASSSSHDNCRAMGKRSPMCTTRLCQCSCTFTLSHIHILNARNTKRWTAKKSSSVRATLAPSSITRSLKMRLFLKTTKFCIKRPGIIRDNMYGDSWSVGTNRPLQVRKPACRRTGVGR